MRIAVIGIGGTGSAAARFLAEEGHEVLGFEQFRIGHDRGSSHGESRIIRYTYADPFYTRLMSEAYPLWDDLQSRVKEPLLVRSGGLFLGPRDHSELAAIESALRDAEHPFEILDVAETRRRFPAFRLEPEEIAIFQRDSGFLRPSACVAANTALARSRGATLLEEERVASIGWRSGAVRIKTSTGAEHEADGAIVTAGAWMGKLFSDLSLPLEVTRQEIVYLRIARNPDDFEPGRFPIWIDARTYDYGIPSDGRIPGVKIAIHRRGDACDPDADRRHAGGAHVLERIGYASRRFPDLSGEVTHTQVCLYTNTPDEDFILDRAPGMPDVWLVSGCSGHGFKFTVLLGRIAAGLATGGAYAGDLGRFSLDRFATPQGPGS